MRMPLDDARDFLHEVLEILRAGNAEDATDEEREKRDRLLSSDSKVSGEMIDSIIKSVEERTE